MLVKGDVVWYCQATVIAWCPSRAGRECMGQHHLSNFDSSDRKHKNKNALILFELTAAYKLLATESDEWILFYA